MLLKKLHDKLTAKVNNVDTSDFDFKNQILNRRNRIRKENS